VPGFFGASTLAQADVGTRAVPDSAEHGLGSGEVRRHVSAIDGLLATIHSDVTTVYEAFE